MFALGVLARRVSRLASGVATGAPVVRARLDNNWTPGTVFVRTARWSEMIDVAEALVKGTPS